MIFQLNAAASLLVGAGAVLGWSRIYRIDRSFMPFLLLLTLAFVQEAVSIVFIYRNHNNTVLYNVFGLVESQLLLLQFYCWKLWRKNSLWYFFWVLLFLLLWGSEWAYWGSLRYTVSPATVIFALCIVFFAMIMLTQQLVPVLPALYKNAIFVICIGLILFHTCAAIAELFLIFGVMHDHQMGGLVMVVLSVINFLTNLLFTWAICFIPFSFRYIFRY
ncbi:hypothetical protein [Niabella hirudinis]|uniref:hypothetical protein n=1 Tax=Niabella hirudinis TaxID=1285929 RepID=UPI003EBA84EA